MLPWDIDIDIGILGANEALLRHLVTPYSQFNQSDINLVARPGDYCPTNGDRRSCKGQKVNYMVDSCSFCGPMARVISMDSFIDIYRAQLKRDTSINKLYFFDEGSVDDGPAKKIPLNVIMPLKTCKFMGLTVLCPNQPEKCLTNNYGNFKKPAYTCVDGKWQ